jgi:putative heme iron utilization protein
MTETLSTTAEPIAVLRAVDDEAIRLAKTLLRTARYGALATLDPKTGAPVATRVGVATDFDGSPILLISGLTAHYAALLADGRCSLLLGEPGKGDPLAHARMTISASATIISRDDAETARLAKRYLAHQPKAKLYAELGDFRYVKLTPTAVSLNAGFGKAYALTPEQLLSSNDQALAAAEFGAVEHMNEDHADSIDQYARHYLNAQRGNWALAGLDADGMTLALGDDVRRIFFDTPATIPQDFHITLVQMAKAARKGLGEL